MGSFRCCSEVFAIVAISAAIVIPCALATEYVVGDDKGWTTGVDYQIWAQGKHFFVGDTLIFKYPKGKDNVYKVNGTAFKGCSPPADIQPQTSGNDAVPLTTPGRKWFISGVGLHCDAGQKLVITVLDPQAAAAPENPPRPSPTIPQPSLPSATPPPPPPPSGATKAAVSGHLGFMVMAFGILAGIMIMA